VSSAAFGGGMIIGLLIAIPIALIFTLIGVFIIAGVFHLFCMMFGAQGGFNGTFRAVVYAWSPMIIIQLIGNIIQQFAPTAMVPVGILMIVGTIWAFVLLVVALREIHGLSTGGAFGAAFIPVMILIGLIVLLVISMGAAFMNAMQNAPGGGFRNAPGGFGSGPSGGFSSPNFPPPSTPGSPGNFGPGSGLGQ
jgi:hypothetical protein